MPNNVTRSAIRLIKKIDRSALEISTLRDPNRLAVNYVSHSETEAGKEDFR